MRMGSQLRCRKTLNRSGLWELNLAAHILLRDGGNWILISISSMLILMGVTLWRPTKQRRILGSPDKPLGLRCRKTWIFRYAAIMKRRKIQRRENESLSTTQILQ